MARVTRLPLLELPRFDGQGGGQWAQLYCTMITPGKKRRIYDQKFKEAAVEMYVNGSRSAPAIARELGICRRSLNLWVKKLNPTAKPIPASPVQVQRDLRAAREELQSLRKQCEILKKTIAILSGPPSAAKE